ncbi:helix-turn-helix domain-containing protein [Paenibacillus hexagrammi]|uniref:Helix-turn-helix domain-containing protein n=1 Tax=Paenibacillus hexagrammi TaxID=2908839 RepID=A0ABY3SNG1_9BACL|nr:helix-turn-helix domain-containing protein [Paenibacillus sp. YPD9-1]UJF35486.1 helix-turn-helix domain-containing protein [Paenibacillus sp. YPD9-1]
MRERIDWKREGFIYCGDAPDGEVALSVIERVSPDIVITDIEMPFMNGLEVSRILKKNMPSVKVVVMSGHDEFRYVREALRYGVFEYCLKPISQAELLGILRKVASQIDAERQRMMELEIMKQRAESFIQVAREKLLRELCFGTTHAIDIGKSAAELNLDLAADRYMIMIIESHLDDEYHRGNRSGILKEICSLVQCRLTESFYFQMNADTVVWLVKGNCEQELTKRAEQFIHRDVPHVEIMLSCKLYVGVGGRKSRLDKIPSSYQEAVSDLSTHFARKAEKNGKNRFTIALKEFTQIDRNKLIAFIKSGKAVDVDAFVKQFIAPFKDTDWAQSFTGYHLCLDVLLTALPFIRETNTNSQLQDELILQLETSVTEITDYGAAFTFISELLGFVITRRDRKKHKNNHDLIAKAQNYIKLNYHGQELSLHLVADYVNVSPSYFSVLFSQFTGKSFTEYVTSIRLKRAKELLETSDAKTYEIAHMVGYQDPHYFSTIFKKSTGITAREFRKFMQQEG